MQNQKEKFLHLKINSINLYSVDQHINSSKWNILYIEFCYRSTLFGVGFSNRYVLYFSLLIVLTLYEFIY